LGSNFLFLKIPGLNLDFETKYIYMRSTLVVHPLIKCLQRLVSKVHFTFASVSRVCHIIKISDALSKAFYIPVLSKVVSHEQRHMFLIFTTTEDFISKREIHLIIESSGRGFAIAIFYSPEHMPTSKQQSSYAASVAWIHYPDKSNPLDWVCVRTIEDLGEVLPPGFSRTLLSSADPEMRLLQTHSLIHTQLFLHAPCSHYKWPSGPLGPRQKQSLFFGFWRVLLAHFVSSKVW